MLFFFRTIVRWRRFIVVSTLAGAVIMAVVSLLLPQWYQVRTTIFPPETSPTSPMYTQVLQSMSLPLLGPMASGIAPETIYIEMLKSRSIAVPIIKEFNLMSVYGDGIIEDAIDSFHSHCGFTLMENGLLVITFEDKDPKRAAQIANRMVEHLDEFNRKLNVTRAGRTRAFVEEQLDKRKVELERAEQAMRDFQEKNQTLEMDQQLKAALDIVSDLTSRAISLETELDILSHYTSKSSEDYKRKKTEYQEVLSQLKKLKTDAGDRDQDLVRSFIPALSEVPELAMEMLRLKREVEIQTTVYTMLVKEYEKARIDEARDTPTVQVLDHAEVPNRRSRPQRKILVLLGALLGAGWGSVVALFTTAWRDGDGQSAVIRDVISPLVSDARRLFRRR